MKYLAAIFCLIVFAVLTVKSASELQKVTEQEIQNNNLTNFCPDIEEKKFIICSDEYDLYNFKLEFFEAFEKAVFK